MATKRRRFTAEFKKRVALDALRGDHTIQAVAAKHQVHPSQVSTWKRQAVEGLREVFSNGRSKREKNHEARIRELHAKIGELTVERDFFCAGWDAESVRADRDDGTGRGVERASAVPVAGDQSILAVLHAKGGEPGEPGADAPPGRVVSPVSVLR